MSESYGKIIELLAIERDTEAFGLRINLSLIESAELIWLTDNETIANITAVSEFDGDHKYRLSLHTAWDANKQQYIGSITRTYRDHSERFSFACSVHFRNELESIKKIRHVDDLHTLPFLSTHRSEADQPEEMQAEEHIKTSRFARKRRHLPLKLVSAVMMSLIFVVLLSSFNYSYPGDIRPHPAVTATAEAETVIQLLAENRSALIAKPVAALRAEEAESKPKDINPSASLPQLELEDFISFGLPKGYVALTFDDGPSKHSIDIMNVLKKYKVGGTFFFVGTNVKKHPDYVRAIHANGYSVGSHSMTHSQMPSLTYEQQQAEMTRVANLIEHITDEKLVLFRPPYGAFDDRTEALSRQQGSKMVLWNRDPEDWLTRDEDKILDYVQHIEASGSIILLHESQAVVDALPKIIKHLQDQGLTIVSLQ
ncbi:polysaccharide deacetylase family protein [Paenibacillus lautus]|uniref:polysaccharide deacetylase family protein n=1 Tax=Paenibacillus lautus TaxID=1401 RepID=UPI002DBB67EF|nr:polysaccharide deacetylase family protein [Paenibacillus lautus]MEC0253943.1 polysaccharide deacetylase family protein [Paenibacillus lautus]